LGIIKEGPVDNIPENIYDLLANVRNEQENVKGARKDLEDAESQYKKFLAKKVKDLEALAITHECIKSYETQLQNLGGDISDSDWPEIAHVQKYNKCLDDIKKNLLNEALDLREHIIESFDIFVA